VMIKMIYVIIVHTCTGTWTVKPVLRGHI
jgi:hypothetical protein